MARNGLLLALLCGVGVAADAQCVALRMSPELAAEGGTEATVTVYLTNEGAPLDGWQWGVCDDDLVTISDGDVAEGAALAALRFSVHEIGVAPGGWTASALLDRAAGEMLPAGTDHEMYLATYALDSSGSAALGFGDGLGVPEVSVQVSVDGMESQPATTDGSIDIALDPAEFTFTVDTPVVYYDPDRLADPVTFFVTLVIEENPENPGLPTDSQAFVMALAHDGAVLDALDIQPTPLLATVNHGGLPQLFALGVDPNYGMDDGVYAAPIYSRMGGVYLAFDGPTAVLEVEYEVLAPELLEGNTCGFETALRWSNELGVIDLINSVVAGGVSYFPRLIDEHVRFVPVLTESFQRGDCNDDGRIDIADGIFLLRHLFGTAEGAGAAPTCDASCDVDAREGLGLADATGLFDYLFQDGAAPAAPFPECGVVDPSLEECKAQESCE